MPEGINIGGLPPSLGIDPITFFRAIRRFLPNRPLPAAGSFPGYDPQGNDVFEDIINKYQYADYTIEDPAALAQQFGIPADQLDAFLLDIGWNGGGQNIANTPPPTNEPTQEPNEPTNLPPFIPPFPTGGSNPIPRIVNNPTPEGGGVDWNDFLDFIKKLPIPGGGGGSSGGGGTNVNAPVNAPNFTSTNNPTFNITDLLKLPSELISNKPTTNINLTDLIKLPTDFINNRTENNPVFNPTFSPNISFNQPTDSPDKNAVPEWLVPILASIAGGLENRPSSSTSTLTSSGTPTVNQTGIMNSFDPQSEDLRQQILSKWGSQLNDDPNLEGYAANQLSDINRLYDQRKNETEGTLAMRGITGPAAASALRGLDSERFGKSVAFRNSIPLTARSLREDTLAKAGQFFSTIPYNRSATETTAPGTNTATTNATGSGNILGGIAGGLGEALAALYGITAGQRRPATI